MEAVKTIDWNRYDLKNWEDMQVSIFINFTSVYVPYTGAGKLAIAQEEEIVLEIRNALMECARDVATYLHSVRRGEEQEARRQIFFRYIGEVSEALHDITGKPRAELEGKLRKIAEEKTSILEQQDDEAEMEELDKIEKAASKAMKDEGEEE